MFGRRGTFVASSGQMGTGVVSGSQITSSTIYPINMSYFKRYKTYIQPNLQTAQITFNANTGSGAITYSAATAAAGLAQGASITTGITQNSNPDFVSSSSNTQTISKNITFVAQIDLPASAIDANSCCFIGMGNNGNPYLTTAGALQNASYVGFYWNGTNFRIVNQKASVTSETAVISTPTASTHIFGIVTSSTAIGYYIDGTLVGTLSTGADLPTAALVTFVAAVANPGAAAEKIIKVSSVQIECDR